MRRFAEAAGRLAGIAGWLLGWRPDEFWRATPAELASVLRAARGQEALGGEALVRVDLDGETARKADQWPMETRIREVEQGPDGAIWLLTDGEDGKLLKLTPG